MINLIVTARGDLRGYTDGWRGRSLYLGDEPMDPENITAAIRAFQAYGLEHAVAPGEWPNPHEGVTTDEDPRHRGEGGEPFSNLRSGTP